MANIYEVSSNYNELLNMLYDEDIDEQMILDTLESIEGEIEDKADNYAKIIKEIEARVEAKKKEEERIKSNRLVEESRIKVLKENLFNAMQITGKTKFKTSLFSFSICNNGGLATLKLDVDVSKIPNEYFKRTEKELDNTAIRKALDENKIKFAHYEERGKSLRIK